MAMGGVINIHSAVFVLFGQNIGTCITALLASVGTSRDVYKRQHKILDSLKIEMIKGLIIIPVSECDQETAARLEEFEAQGVPVVLIDRDIRNGRFDGVFSEDAEGCLLYTSPSLLSRGL